MTRRLPSYVTFFGIAVAFATGCHASEGQGLPPASGSGAPPPAVVPKLNEVTTEAEPATTTAQAAWTGSLFARHEAELGPKMSGVLSQVTVEEGDKVKKGQLLFRLDAAQVTLGVSQAKAAIATAQVGNDAASREFARTSELMMKGSIAPATFDQAKSAKDQAASALEQAKVALQVAQRSSADTAIYSPIDGVVTAKLKSVGETVTMMPPTVVVVVQDVDKLELRAHLPEQALSTLAVGSALTITIRTVNVTRDVLVKRINPTLEPHTRTVEVVADVDNADGKLKVGMLTEVALREAAAPDKDKTAVNLPAEPE